MRIKHIYLLPLLTSFLTYTTYNQEVASALYALSTYYKKTNPILSEKYKKLALQENSIDALFFLGCDYVKDGDIQKAKKYFKKMQDIDLPNPLFEEVSTTLKLAYAVLNGNIENALHYAYIEHEQEKLRNAEYPTNWIDMLGDICFFMGKYDAAEIAYQQAIDIGIGNVYSKLARFYYEQRNIEYAIQAYKIALEKGEDSYALERLGKIYYEQGQLDLAQEFFEMELFEHSIDARIYLGLIECSRSNISLAKQHLKDAYIEIPEDLIDPKEIKILVKKQKKHSRKSWRLNDLGNAYYHAKQFDLALPYLLQAQELEPNNYRLTTIAKIYRKQGKLDLAEKTLLEIVHTSYGKWDALYELGKVYALQEQYILAEKYYKQAYEKAYFETKEKALIGLIRVCRKQQHPAKIQYYVEELKIADHEDLYQHGLYYQEHNNLKDAKYKYKLAMELGNIHAMYSLACIYYQERKFDKAEKYLQILVKKGVPDTYNLLGVVYMDKKEFDQAEQLFQQVLEPAGIDAIHNLIKLYLQKNKITKAIKALQDSLKNHPCSACFYLLAFCLEKQGNLVDAKKYYELASTCGDPCAIGKVYLLNEQFDLAEQCFQRALDNGDYRAYYHLSVLYKQLGQNERATQYLQHADNCGIIY